MTEPVVTKEGQEILARILNIRPSIAREERKAKYLRILSLLMTECISSAKVGQLCLQD